MSERSDTLEAEVEELRELVDTSISGIVKVTSERDEARAEAEQWKNAFDEFGNHTEDCARVWDFERRCDCGWAELDRALIEAALTAASVEGPET
ncbi:MAG: hypothetical protein GY795_24645 [Desulfobacterales bacterium]|nr:hypothetical protein [Desulfobacterales bacterium]